MEKLLTILLALMVATFAGCATSRKTDIPVSHTTAGLQTASTLDISYLLGHNVHRFFAQMIDTDQVVAESSLDHQVLKKGPIDKEGFMDLISKVRNFIERNGSQEAADLTHCRHPFTIKLKMNQDIRTIQGCRNPDNSALSRLARDAEFLLYSKK
jgi:hypothetical protein